MLQGTIVQNSLTDPSILKELSILKSWPEGTWNLHQVNISREQALKLADKSSWKEATAHGKSIGIPDEQLDFVIY